MPLLQDNAAQDQQFVTGATQSGQSEIDEGQIAQHAAGSFSAAEFGTWMAADHSWLQSGLNVQAAQDGLVVPAGTLNPDQQANLDALAPLQGAAFDARYVPGEVADHVGTIALFQTEAASGSAANLVATAQGALPILDQHLNAAQLLDSYLGGTPSPGFTQPAAVALPAAAPEGSLSAQDVAFVNAAGQSGLTEIAAGQMAEQKAPDAFVAGFGDWMVTDHTALNAAAGAIAAAGGVASPVAPNADQQAMLTNLQGLSGTAFETQYLNGEIQGHLQTLAVFQQEALAGSDPALVAAAHQAMPLLQAHLAAAVTEDVAVTAGLNDRTAAPDTAQGQFLQTLQSTIAHSGFEGQQAAQAVLDLLQPGQGAPDLDSLTSLSLGGVLAFIGQPVEPGASGGASGLTPSWQALLGQPAPTAPVPDLASLARVAAQLQASGAVAQDLSPTAAASSAALASAMPTATAGSGAALLASLAHQGANMPALLLHQG